MFGLGGGGGGNGGNGSATLPSSALPATATATPTPTGGKDDDEKFQGFDPRGLERAAKAAKELEASAVGKDAITLAREQERTQQLKLQNQVEENRARAAAFQVEAARAQEEERRRTLEAEHRAQQAQAQYQDQLARKRAQDQLQAQQALHAQELKRQEESAMRIEQLRRESAQYEAQLRKETDAARAIAEAKGRTEQERANFDLTLQRARLEAAEMRTTVLEGIRESAALVGQGTRDFLSDPKRVGASLVTLSLLALGVYSAKVSTGVVGRYVEARLGKPPLVRETSRRTLFQALRSPVRSLSDMIAARRASYKDALAGVVLEPRLKQRLETLALTTANTKRNRAPFRNVLLYGPPGTGKTLFAKKLARASGMDFAIMTGGDVAPLGRDAVTEIHKLFDWAKTSSKGVVIFVDESDAFLRKRAAVGQSPMSEEARNALNAFLYRTGTESKDFMMVFATNLPDQLDFAVADRADEAVEFALPGAEERLQLLKMYFDRHVRGVGASSGGMLSFGGPTPIVVSVDKLDEKLKHVAFERLKGFSGREIAKLAIAFQAAAHGTPDATLTEKLLDDVVDVRVDSHEKKVRWHLGSEAVGDAEAEAEVVA